MKTFILSVLFLAPCAKAGTALRSQDLPNALMVSASTPTASSAVFEVRASSNVKPADYVIIVSSFNATVIMDVTEGGHIASHGAAPVISSCGTTPSGSVTGNDIHGTISVGGGVVTSCTLTFATPHTNTPDCVISDNSTSVTGDLSSVSASAITVSFSASLGGGKIFYHCWGD